MRTGVDAHEGFDHHGHGRGQLDKQASLPSGIGCLVQTVIVHTAESAVLMMIPSDSRTATAKVFQASSVTSWKESGNLLSDFARIRWVKPSRYVQDRLQTFVLLNNYHFCLHNSLCLLKVRGYDHVFVGLHPRFDYSAWMGCLIRVTVCGHPAVLVPSLVQIL
jgi:hypothetical protein